MKTEELRKLFFRKNPYDGFDATGFPLKVKGWHSDRAVFRRLIGKHRPTLYIEVGTWLGASAIHAAAVMDEAGVDSPILCVDTWLGAQEFWEDVAQNERFEDLETHCGFPAVYYRFLANVVQSGHAERIVPLPQTSVTAARLLKRHAIKAELIYIDCSHDAGDVFRDLESYWEILDEGGVMFGDDYDEFWPDLVHDVNRFAVSRGLELETNDGVWILRKDGGLGKGRSREAIGEGEVRAALEAENAVLRSRLVSTEAHIELARGDRDKAINEMHDRLVKAERTAGFYAEKTRELEKDIKKLAIADGEETIRDLIERLQEMERRAGFYAEKAGRLQELVDEQELRLNGN